MAIPDLLNIPLRRVDIFKRLAVYNFVTTLGDFVVKADPGEEIPVIQAKWSLDFMTKILGAITPGFPSMRLLSTGEAAFVLGKIGHTRAEFGRNPIFYIMDCVPNLKDFGDLSNKPERIGTDKTTKLERLCALVRKTPAMAKDLGRIVIADMFNASNDRFFFEDNGMPNPVYDLSASATPVGLGNVGNFFVTTDAAMTRGRFLGIDFWDQSNPYRNLTKPIEAMRSADGITVPWAGDLLREGQTKQRDRIATSFAQSFNNKAVRNFNMAPVFTAKHVKEMRKGMSEAREALKKFLKAQVKTNASMQPGVPARMRRLGWA